MKLNLKLARKNRELDPQSWERLKGTLIKQSIREKEDDTGVKLYASEDAELAINRKQIMRILEVLKEHGIDATLTEFLSYNDDAEDSKKKIKSFLEVENEEDF